MNIQEVSANGKTYPLYFGIRAVEEVTAGQETEKLFQKDTFEYMRKALFVGLKHGHKKSSKTFKMSMDDIENLIDDHPEVLRIAWDMFQAAFLRFLNLNTTEDEKK